MTTRHLVVMTLVVALLVSCEHNPTTVTEPGALAAITVTPDPDTLAIGTSGRFTAVGRDAHGNVVEITPTWSTVADGATIDQSGLFTAGSVPGTYTKTVKATSGRVSGFATVTVTPRPLVTITVTPNPAKLGIKAAQQFTAVGKDTGGNVVAITPAWSVVAGGGTIDGSSGLFTAGMAPGTYTNTVKATSGGISGFATVNVSAGALASIMITLDPDTLAIGGTQRFTAVGKDVSGNVVAMTPTWSVVANGGTIDADSGLFTAGKVPGTYVNTVKASSGSISGFATVVVTAGPLATITVTPDPTNIGAGATQQFTAVGQDASGNVVAVTAAWSVVAGGGSIDGEAGLFTAGTLPGTYTNTVKATSDGMSGFATVTVSAGALASITVTPDPANLGIGATQPFTAVGRDAFGNVVAITPNWSVVAGGGTIDGAGSFTAGTVPGTYTNTVKATNGGISGFATMVVSAGVLASITITPNPASLGIGANEPFTAVGKDVSGNVVAITPTWSVVAGGGAINTSSGLFTAGTEPGTYTNTVKAASGGISGFATVTVVAGPLATVTVSPNPASLGIGAAQQFAAVGKDASGNVVAITPTWSLVAGGGAINGSGRFTAGTVPGTYTNTIRASSGDISGFATVNVGAGALASLTVTPNPANIGIGATQPFTAVGKDASGNVVAITPTWSVVAGGGSINAGSGLFTAGTVPGTYTNTVRAASGGISGFATVTVSAGALASITVTPDPSSLSIGAARQFTAVGRDAFGSVVAVTPAWSVVTGGGTINTGSGLFTAGTVPGTYTNTVRATSGGISGFATVSIVAGPVATITVSPDPASLGIGGSQQFTAVGRDASGNVIAVAPAWSIVAGGGTINGAGLFGAGTVPGTYTNTVKATRDGISGFATVTVTAGALASITVTPNPTNLGITATRQFTAVGKDASGNVVAITPAWSVVAGGGGITGTSGLFTAGTVPGTYTNTVRATSGGVSGFATVTVSSGALASITVTPDPANLGVGAAQQFVAVGKDASGNVVAITPTWSVAAGGGTINTGSGLFAAGTVPGTFTNTVKATSGGISAFATVSVSAGALASITVTPDPASVGIGAAQPFTAVGRDVFGNVVATTPTWSVVAGGGTINGAGSFTAGTAPGTYTNTVKATSGGISGFATVVVSAGALASITVTPNPVSLVSTTSQQFTATGRDASGNVVTITPAWSVVAGGGTIGGAGLFTAGTVPGTYTNTVRATSSGISGFATVSVSAGALASITITPDPTDVGIGVAQPFTAVGKDASGNVVAITPTWFVVAGGGTINAGSGLFTAGTVPGTYTNTVKATSGGISGAATVTVTAGPLAAITVSPNPANLGVGAAQQFTAVGRDASGNLVAVTPTWSIDAGGGTISGAGLFTAGTVPGTYTNTVRATSGAISGVATVTVSAGALATIAITPHPVSLASTTSQQFTATGKDAFGNVVAVTPTWSVVAGGGTMGGAGLFTAGTAPGTYPNTVRATSGGISGFATVTVIAGPLATITVSPNPANLGIGAVQQFTAVGRDASGNVVAVTPTWSIVAGGGTIGGAGLFTAGMVPGTYTNTVQATSGGISGFATVTVSAGALASITVTPDPANLGVGGTRQFTAVGKDASGNVVAITPTWSTVAGGGTISGAGLFTAATVPGTYTNTVKAISGGISGFATVTIDAGALAGITVTPNPVGLVITASQQFTATGKDAFGNVVAITPTWSVVSSGGTINGAGLFTAGTVPGTYTNTVKAISGGVSGFATVTVTAGALASITITPDPAGLGVGAAQQFTAVGKDASGNVVAVTPTWSIVAGGGTISGAGLFTAGTVPGTYTNTVQGTSGGISGFATVVVSAGALASITVTPDPANLAIGATQQLTAVGKDATGNVVPITTTWSTVAGGGAISGGGLFTAGTVPGTYTNTVRATSGSVSGFATVTITAGPLATVTVSPDPANLGIGAAQQFTAVGRDASGNLVAVTPTWSVAASGGAISGEGLFTAGTVPGTYTNTVQATSGGISGFATVTVAAGPLATITVSPDPADLGVGATRQFTAVGKDASGNVVPITPTWSTVAGGGAISGAGLFTAGTVPGTYTNTVKAVSGGISGFATVNVTAGPLASITVTPDPASLAITTNQQFNATGRDAFGNVVAITPTWSVVSSGGTINGTGLFTAGTVTGTFTNTVRATSGSISGLATVIVVAGPLAAVTVSPDPASVSTSAAQQFTAVGKDVSGNVVTITPDWSVVAGGGTIDGSGLFTAGTVTGTYTNTVQAGSGGISGFASVTITVNLGAAAPFAVLGGSGASSCAGASSVSGNVGVAPAPGAISGFPAPCTIVDPGDGTVHQNDALAAAARAAVTAVNQTLADMPCTDDLTGQGLGTLNLPPGVYCFASTAQLTGTLTLVGPADGLWVFRIGTALTTAAGAQVTLAGSAQAGNVYWQIGTAATFGASNLAFQGTIIAATSITLGAGTRIIGRAWAEVAVTMDANAIVLP